MNEVIDQSNFIVNKGCSGTLIDKELQLILTNYHCIDGQIEFVERDVFEDGRVTTIREVRLRPVNVEQVHYEGYGEVGTSSYVTDIVARKKTRDLAVLKVRGSLPQEFESPLIKPGKDVTRGERVYAVGNPAGFDATVVEGIVSSTTRTFEFPWTENEELPMIQFSGGITGGNSGGALYNTEGVLVGVPAAGLRGANFIGLAIPPHIIWEVLAEHCLAEDLGGENSDLYCDEEGERKVSEEQLDDGEGTNE